jgi:signal transduction histidine kinase
MSSDMTDGEAKPDSFDPALYKAAELQRYRDTHCLGQGDAPEVHFRAMAQDDLDELITIFTGILSELASFIRYHIASVFVREDSHLRLLLAHNYTPALNVVIPLASVPLFQAMVQSQEPIIIHDVLEEPQFHIFWRELEPRAWMGIPLIVDSTVIGVISFINHCVGAFTARDAHLAKIFIDQAAYALEKAGMARALTAEKRNLELLYELSQSLVETLDPKQVARRAIALTTSALGARSGEIFVLEGPNVDRLTLLAQSGEYFPDPLPDYAFLQIGQGLEGTVVATRQPIVAPDVSQEPRWIPAESGNTDIRSAVAIPLLARDELVGVLSLSSTVQSFFKPENLPALQAVAAPIAMSLQNARLFAAERRRYQETETLRRATSAVVLDLGLDQVLYELLARLQEVVPLDSATILLQEGEFVRAVAALGLPDPNSVIGRRFPTDNVLFTKIQQERRALFYNDVQQIEGFQGWGGTQDVRGWLAVPLRHHGQFIGYLTVDSKRAGAYGENEANLTQAFANQATVTIVNARLLQESQQTAFEQRVVSGILRRLSVTSTVSAVLPTVAPGLCELTGCDRVDLATFDHANEIAYVTRYVSATNTDNVPPTTFQYVLANSAATENILAGHIHQTSDLSLEQAYPLEAAYLDEGYAGRICLPLQAYGQTLGMLQLLWRLGHCPWFDNVAALTQLADSIAMAIEKNRLFTQTQRRIAEMESLNNFTLALRPVETRQSIMHVSLAYVLQTFEGDLIRLCMPAEDADFLEIVLETGDPLSKFPLWFRRQGSIFGYLLDTGQPHLSANLFQDAMAFPTALADWAKTVYRSASAIFAPLHTVDKIIGVISVYRFDPEMQYNQNDLQLLSTMAEIMGTALHRSSILETTEQRVTERTHELAQANERLQELDRLKSEFVANVSHELRTPLTNIRFYLDLLERGRAEKHSHYLSILHAETQRLNLLIESILDLSRFDAARVYSAFKVSSVDVGGLAHEVYLSHQLQAAAKEIAFTCIVSEEPLTIWADRNQIIQVISNLVANAINYTLPGGAVSLLARPAGNDGVEVIVQDTGIGINPKEQSHLFERFYRSPRTTDLGIPGTGLGLSIVKEIVDLHRGTIDIVSEFGEGSVFTVWLPSSSFHASREPHL